MAQHITQITRVYEFICKEPRTKKEIAHELKLRYSKVDVIISLFKRFKIIWEKREAGNVVKYYIRDHRCTIECKKNLILKDGFWVCPKTL